MKPIFLSSPKLGVGGAIFSRVSYTLQCPYIHACIKQYFDPKNISMYNYVTQLLKLGSCGFCPKFRALLVTCKVTKDAELGTFVLNIQNTDRPISVSTEGTFNLKIHAKSVYFSWPPGYDYRIQIKLICRLRKD